MYCPCSNTAEKPTCRALHKTNYPRETRAQVRSATDQNWWQPPEVQLLGGKPVCLALGAIVELVLAQLFLAGEGLQTAIQADGLSLGPTGLLHTAVLLHDLQGDHDAHDTVTVCSSQPGHPREETQYCHSDSESDVSYLSAVCEFCFKQYFYALFKVAVKAALTVTGSTNLCCTQTS